MTPIKKNPVINNYRKTPRTSDTKLNRILDQESNIFNQQNREYTTNNTESGSTWTNFSRKNTGKSIITNQTLQTEPSVSATTTLNSQFDSIGHGTNKFNWNKVKTEASFNKRKPVKEKKPEPNLLKGRNMYSTLTEETNSNYKEMNDKNSNKKPGYTNAKKEEKKKQENERKDITEKIQQKFNRTDK